jgi:ABC-type transport system involved in cytochrome c biogenesis permease subunit
MLIATVVTLLPGPLRASGFRPLGTVAYGLATAAIVLGIVARTSFARQLPITSVFDSAVAVGAGASLFGAIFAYLFRQRYVLASAAGVVSLACLAVEHFPGIFDPAIRPVATELGASPWFLAHQLAFSLASAALALAWGAGNVTLALQLRVSRDDDRLRVLGRCIYQSLQVGTCLLAATCITGGYWANQTLGQAWNWDPKQVWVLIVLLVCLAGLQACRVGWMGRRSLAVFAVAASAPLVMAWWECGTGQAASWHRTNIVPGGADGPVGLLLMLPALQALLVAAVWCRRVWLSSLSRC